MTIVYESEITSCVALYSPRCAVPMATSFYTENSSLCVCVCVCVCTFPRCISV